jgi:xanthine dehydrogenase accessory factor
MVHADGPSPVSALDPVCGMTVAALESSLHFDAPTVGGTSTRYWFCGTGCLRAFAADPNAYPT